MKTLRNYPRARRPVLAGCAALAAGAALAYGLTATTTGDAGTSSQMTQVLTAGSGSLAKTVTQVLTVETPGLTGVTALAAPPAAPAQMVPASAEIPVSPSLLSYTNGWTVSDGPVQMSVFAGSDASNPSTGMLVTITNNLGDQSTKVVKLAGTGALTISGALPSTKTAAMAPPSPQTPPEAKAEQVPPSAQSEARAENGTLRFTSASGATGLLHLQTATASTS